MRGVEKKNDDREGKLSQVESQLWKWLRSSGEKLDHTVKMKLYVLKNFHLPKAVVKITGSWLTL